MNLDVMLTPELVVLGVFLTMFILGLGISGMIADLTERLHRK